MQQGIDIRLKEATIRDALLAALARTGLQATDDTKINFVSAAGEPVVIEVTELKMGAPPPAYAPPPAEAAPASGPRAAPRSAPRPVKSKELTVSDVEEKLFGGQEAWPEAQPHLPDERGKIVMPDAGKHVDGQLDDNEVVTFDIKRFAVEPVPEGESPSLRSTTSRAYETPEEPDDIPDAYRAGPPPPPLPADQELRTSRRDR